MGYVSYFVLFCYIDSTPKRCMLNDDFKRLGYFFAAKVLLRQLTILDIHLTSFWLLKTFSLMTSTSETRWKMACCAYVWVCYTIFMAFSNCLWCSCPKAKSFYYLSSEVELCTTKFWDSSLRVPKYLKNLFLSPIIHCSRYF